MQLLANGIRMENGDLQGVKRMLLFWLPALYAYAMVMWYVQPLSTVMAYANSFLMCFVFLVALLPYFNRTWCQKYYPQLVFVSLLLVAQYTILATSMAQFHFLYLAVSCLVLFGSLVLLPNISYGILFGTLFFVHYYAQIRLGELAPAQRGQMFMVLSMALLGAVFLVALQHNLQLQKARLEHKMKLRTKDLERRAKELVRKNKELEEFAYVVSHDMKSPLRNVHSLGSWVREDLDAGAYGQAASNMQLLLDQVGQMDLLVDGILKYSLGIEKKKVTQFLDLNQLVDELIKANNAKKVHIEKDSSLPRLLMDKVQMLQVFQNLVQNAIKYNDKPMALINIGVVDEVDRFKFYVRDNGMGISKEHYGRIFKLFQKLGKENGRNSSGIGLAVVKKIVHKNGGEVWLESTEGKGTTFYFTLYKEDVTPNFGAKNQ
ncbi:sensor histidine kinase [Maribacter sp. 2307ULW6-5]|uniref:sensor histidine kinase n=1 Tax=Maribacter sp. 2307ULW6-5 TaxID=3386275 RepID=UPI0039BD7588